MDRRFLRPGWMAGHLLVILAVVVCLRLGWWQWERTHDADGTGQNLGYALLWPAFAVAFVYMWIRFLQLEKLRDLDDAEAFDEGLAEILADGAEPGPSDAAAEVEDSVPEAASTTATADPAAESESDTGPDPQQPAPRRREAPSRGVIVSVADVGDDDSDDPELAAYNRALAELAERDRKRAT